MTKRTSRCWAGILLAMLATVVAADGSRRARAVPAPRTAVPPGARIPRPSPPGSTDLPGRVIVDRRDPDASPDQRGRSAELHEHARTAVEQRHVRRGGQAHGFVALRPRL